MTPVYKGMKLRGNVKKWLESAKSRILKKCSRTQPFDPGHIKTTQECFSDSKFASGGTHQMKFAKSHFCSQNLIHVREILISVRQV